MFERAAALGLVGLILAGCGDKTAVVLDVTRLEVSCPNPTERKRLSHGSTYRDLALSRSEAIAGWERCHGALDVVNLE
jgi:hypothetical protein